MNTGFDGRLVFAFLVLAWGTAALAQGLPPTWPVPDAPMAASFLLGCARSRRMGLWCGFAYGLAADLLGYGRVVGGPFVYALAGHLGGEIGVYLTEESPLVVLAYPIVRLLLEGVSRLLLIAADVPSASAGVFLGQWGADASAFIVLYFLRGPLGLGRRRIE